MASKGLVRFDPDNPEFPDPTEASDEDWAFFAGIMWEYVSGAVTLRVSWSIPHDIQHGCYVCQITLNQDWDNPIEEVRTRSPQDVSVWIFERLFYI